MSTRLTILYQYGHKLNSFIKPVKKMVNAKAKTKLRPNSNEHKINQYYFQDNKSIEKINTFNNLMKNLRVKKSKAKRQPKDPKVSAC